MSNQVKSLLRLRRTTLASAAALALGASAPVLAMQVADSSYRFGQFDGIVDQTLALNDYTLWITAPQLNTGALSGTAVGINYLAQLAGPAQTGTPVIQTGNAIAARAAGNQASSRIDLALLAPTGTGADGAAILTGQLRRDASSQSLVTSSGVGTTLVNMPVANQVISANTLSATTTLNQSNASIDGTVAAGTGAARAGHVSAAMDLSGSGSGAFGMQGNIPGTMVQSSADGNVNVANAQVASNAGQSAGSLASLANGYVVLAALPQDAAPVTAQLSITGNALSAEYSGNRATSQVAMQGGSAPLGGSVAVSNVQANTEDDSMNVVYVNGVPAPTAIVANSAVRADLLRGIGAPSEFAGALAITGNSVVARSTGNSATARDGNGTQVAGNAIVLTAASDVLGGESLGFSGAGVTGISAGGEVRADLAVASIQGNKNTAFVSTVDTTTIATRLDQLAAGASVALNANTVAAAATGNIAGNRVEVDATRIAASAAASNTQSNGWTEVWATNTGARVESSIGVAGRDATGSVSLTANRLDASAAGNVADTQVALSASQLGVGGRPAGTLGGTLFGGIAIASGDATAVNAQNNQYGTVRAQLADGGIAASFSDPQSGPDLPVGLQGASVSLKDNVLRSQATGNDAATGVALNATTGLASAAVASMQASHSWLSSDVLGTAVTFGADRMLSSSVGLDGNVLAAASVANRADNRLAVQAGSLQVAAVGGFLPGFFGEGVANAASGDLGSASAGFTLLNTQSNQGGTSVNTFAPDGMVLARVADQGYPGTGLDNSQVAVGNNTVSATATGNQAANTLSLQAGALGTGSETGIGAPVAALTSVQSSQAFVANAAAGGSGAQLVIGAQFGGNVTGSTLAVTGNTVAASNLANTVANRLDVTGTTYLQNAGGGMARSLQSDISLAAVQNDFSLVNRQSDDGGNRMATTSNVGVGIDGNRIVSQATAVTASTLTVAGNRSLAEVRINDAANAITLGGFSALDAGAGLANGQDNDNSARANAEGSFRIQVPVTNVHASTLALTDNVTRALAVANLADNRIVAQATTLRGPGSAIDPSLVPETGVASTAGFAVGNAQTQSAQVYATTSGATTIDLIGGGLFGSAASLAGNVSAAVAQGNSGTNLLALSAGTASGVTGEVTSAQNGYAGVRATAGPLDGQGAFLVRSQGLFASSATVANNTLQASAGQNEAFNQLSLSASSLGSSIGAISFGFMPVGAAADFSVRNQQYGEGSVDAAVMPGMIGVQSGFVDGSAKLAVTGNQVSARANVNTASNALTLAAGGVQGASGAVSNLQSTGTGPVNASVGAFEGLTTIGVMPDVLNGSAVAVTGNSLTALAGGNSGSNALNATGAALATGSANGGFAVLNNQSNNAAMNAAVRNATIGVSLNGFGIQGIGLTSASAAVNANNVAASSYGNTASNAIGLGLPQAGTTVASASLVNRQANAAAISATVSNVGIGLTGVAASGLSAIVSGNSVSAQAVGNSVVNSIGLK